MLVVPITNIPREEEGIVNCIEFIYKNTISYFNSVEKEK